MNRAASDLSLPSRTSPRHDILDESTDRAGASGASRRRGRRRQIERRHRHPYGDSSRFAAGFGRHFTRSLAAAGGGDGFSGRGDGAAAVAVHASWNKAVAAQDFSILGWREVPTRPGNSGRDCGVDDAGDPAGPVDGRAPGTLSRMRNRGCIWRASTSSAADAQGYVCSLSSSSIIYKAMCAARLLPEFYPDLADERFVTPFALFHQRYATNVAPSWDRAQPFRILGHNGEINTIWGNRARMTARAATLPDELQPIFTPSGSDSTSLDEVIELLARNGRTVAEAVRMVMPPADTGRHSAFLAYHGDCIEPWDGPAAVSFTDGHLIGAALDRNGLRPCRFFVTEDQSDRCGVGSGAGRSRSRERSCIADGWGRGRCCWRIWRTTSSTRTTSCRRCSIEARRSTRRCWKRRRSIRPCRFRRSTPPN